MREAVTVYFDYLCPFVWRAAEVTEMVSEVLGLEFRWQHFSLYQSDFNGASNWQLWNDRLDGDCDNGCKGLVPFLASCAARRQGTEVHDRFRLALLRARHKEHRTLTMATVQDVATHAELDMDRFLNDLSDPECRTCLAHEHYRAKALDVFGTPTFHFETGQLAYFRIKQLPADAAEAVALFQAYRELLEAYPYLETIKRPRPKRN